MKKGFTLLEISLVILLAGLLMIVVSNFYLGIIKALIIADVFQNALENVKMGSEKIFRITKYGWDFEVTSTQISFYDRNCDYRYLLRFRNNNLILEKKDRNGNPIESEEIFDPQIIKVKDFRIYKDKPLTTETFFYFQYAPKIIIYFYDLELKTKIGTSSLIFEQGVAPLNSVQNISLCSL